MIKRVMSIALLVITLFFLTACSNSDKNIEITGHWIPTTAVINGNTVDYNTLGLEEGQFSLDFKADGKCSIVLTGIKNNGTYTFSGSSIDVDTKNLKQKLSFSNNTISLTLDYENNPMIISFTREFN
ncbi:MAG: DUF4923 family protein [Ruminococcus sp.]|nr:DUF4923 family protein [Ruminococcus sp.]